MSKKTIANKKYLKNLVRKVILSEQMGVSEPFGGPAGSLHGTYDPKDELPTWEGTKKWWSSFGRATMQLADFVEDNISRDIQFKNEAPLQAVARVKLSESKKYEDFIKSYFMFYSKFSFNDFYCDPEPRSEGEKSIEESKNKVNEMLLFEKKRVNDPTRKSCDYFANYTGWMSADSTIEWLLKTIEKERKPTITKASARARSALGGSRPPAGVTGKPFGSVGGIQRENHEEKYLKEQNNTLNRGQMATLDGIEKKECPTLHIDGEPANDELQKQFCEFRAKKWSEYVNGCNENPETSWCKETEETPKVEKLNIFDEYGQPGQGFEDETAFIFKDYLQMQSRTSTSLSGIGGQFDDIGSVGDASKDASRIYRVLKSELKEYFTNLDDSDHAWMRFTGPFAYAAVDMAASDASAILSSYMLVPEKYFVENVKVLSENINELLRDRDRSSRGLKEVSLPESGNILDYVPNFVIKLLSIRIFRHVLSARELVDIIIGSISNRRHKDDTKSLNRCLKKIKKRIIREIETRDGKKLHQAFYNYLILASLDPAGDEVTEKDILAMVNLEENPGEDFTLGQQLLAFLAVSTPEAQLVMQPILNGVAYAGRVAMSANRTAPKGGWWTAIITGTIFVGQIAWFFLDPINKMNLNTMKEQFDNILKDMKTQKDIAIRNRKAKIIEEFRSAGQTIDPSEAQAKAETSFKFKKEQVNDIKKAINAAVSELSYEINQAVEMTLSNISQKGGLSSDNLEKRLTIIKSYVAIGQALKSSINQMDRVELYINHKNWQQAYDAIEKSKEQAVELFQNTKVPDTAITLEEQAARQIKFSPNNPGRNITMTEMKNLLVSYCKYISKKGEKKGANKLFNSIKDILILYYAGPLLVDGQKISRQIGFSPKSGTGESYWKAASSRAKQIKDTSGFDSYLDSRDLDSFNTLTDWDIDKNRQYPDISRNNGVKKKYIVKGFYTSRLQSTGGEEMGSQVMRLAAIPYAFGYDGMINRFGYQGSIFVSDPFDESFDSIKDKFFGNPVPKVIQVPQRNSNNLNYHVAIDKTNGDKWSTWLWKYKTTSTASNFDPIEALASLPVSATGGEKNILSIINSISESSDWDESKIKTLEQVVAEHAQIIGPRIFQSTNPSEFNRNDIAVLITFLKAFQYKIKFDRKLVEALRKIEVERENLMKSDIQGEAFDFNSIYKNSSKKPTVQDDATRRAVSKKAIKSSAGKRKAALIVMIKYMAAVEKFILLDNMLEGIQNLGR